MEVLIFFAFLDNFLFFVDIKYLSKPPLKSTVLNAALATFNLISFFNISLLNVTFFKFGKNLRFYLFFEFEGEGN